eukprot:m.14916 g.14916  ORF g.14916 m.14916 type:complete len:511 (+) comp6457_c0_seq1:112-1644(+)
MADGFLVEDKAYLRQLVESEPLAPCNHFFADPEEDKVDPTLTKQVFTGATLGGRFIVKDGIQSGNFGRGWKAYDQLLDQDVFLKTFRSQADTEGGPRPPSEQAEFVNMIRKELDFWLHDQSFEYHENIVASQVFYGQCTVPTNKFSGNMFFVAAELCSKGELYDYMLYEGEGGFFCSPFEETMAQIIFRQVLSGVAFLHARACFHRDLKLENIVVGGDSFTLKITDFGSARWGSDLDHEDDAGLKPLAKTIVGTPQYHPPEMQRGVTYNPAAFDVWSLGVVLLFVLCIRETWEQEQYFDLFLTIKEQQRLCEVLDSHPDEDGRVHNEKLWKQLEKVSSTWSAQLKDILNCMLVLDVPTRSTAAQLIEHPWVHMDLIDQATYVANMQRRFEHRPARDVIVPLNPDVYGNIDEALEDIATITENAVIALGGGTEWSQSELERSDRSQPPKRRIVECEINESMNTILVGKPLAYSVTLSPDYRSCQLRWCTESFADWMTFRKAFLRELASPYR